MPVNALRHWTITAIVFIVFLCACSSAPDMPEEGQIADFIMAYTPLIQLGGEMNFVSQFHTVEILEVHDAYFDPVDYFGSRNLSIGFISPHYDGKNKRRVLLAPEKLEDLDRGKIKVKKKTGIITFL